MRLVDLTDFLEAECSVKGDDVYVSVGNQSQLLPCAKGRRLSEGGYGGKKVILGIRPEDVYDREVIWRISPA